MSGEAKARPGADAPVSGAEHGAHAADFAEGGRELAPADQAADLFAFEEGLDAFRQGPIPPPAKRGPGRPPGSPNRSTSQVRQYLEALGYRDPLEADAALATADPRVVAAALAGKKVEDVTFGEAMAVFDQQAKARARLQPYWHQELPKASAVKPQEVRHLIVIADGAAGKGERDQRVIEAVVTTSHDDVPLNDAQHVDITDVFGARSHD